MQKTFCAISRDIFEEQQIKHFAKYQKGAVNRNLYKKTLFHFIFEKTVTQSIVDYYY